MTPRAHVLLAVLVVASLVAIVRLVRSRQLKVKYSLLWLSLGGAMAVIAVVPGLLDWAAGKVGIYYQPALLMFLGLLFLLLVAMHFSYELTRSENRMRSMAEEVALLRHRLDQLSSEPAEAEEERPAGG